MAKKGCKANWNGCKATPGFGGKDTRIFQGGRAEELSVIGGPVAKGISPLDKSRPKGMSILHD